MNKYKPKLGGPGGGGEGGKESEGGHTSTSSVTIKDDICSPIMSHSNPDIIPEKGILFTKITLAFYIY